VFERFTGPARNVFVLADEEARRLRHAYIGTEHFLLGLLRETDGLAARVLHDSGVALEPVRFDVERIVGLGDEEVRAGELPLTPRMKAILELSQDEADRMRHPLVGTEHLLLALAREGNGVANVILHGYGVRSDDLRRTVVDLVSGSRAGQH
jgi:ATP-dependent Clp protease ATP-binding subunit ClpC